MSEHILQYCYRYEPGFPVYCLLDLVLAKEGEETAEVVRFNRKENELDGKEDENQILFHEIPVILNSEEDNHYFIKVALYPKEKKETNVVNLVFSPLTKPWDDYTVLEQDGLIKEIVGNQEKLVTLKYYVVDLEEMELTVE
jgi:hypothetical protein